ncbi:MAG: NFACT RNA binding domain-containing protein [Bacteroidota bacterium]|nr:NFACT RNA binding domain-containing protein [Bacteroidota bacterium]
MTYKEAQSYPFICLLSKELNYLLKFGRIISCFSQNKDELIIEIRVKNKYWYLISNLLPEVSLLKLTDNFHRANKNSVNIFPEIIGVEIIEIKQHFNERSFHLALSNQLDLIFKLHGPNSNILLAKSRVVASIFKHNLIKDFQFKYADFDFVVPYISIAKPQILDAYNQLFDHTIRNYGIETKKENLIKKWEHQIKKNEQYIKANTQKLKQLLEDVPFEQIGHILMANAHLNLKGQKSANFINYYDGNEITINLKPNISIQENAASYYKKHKNRKLELEKLEQTIASKQQENTELKEQLEKVKTSNDYFVISSFEKKSESKLKDKVEPSAYFFEFIEMGFVILAGKNAKSNDLLTTKYCHKNDLWLHAKDATGSHVVVKWQSGKNYPRPVLEKAASIAAFLSKRKTEKLVLVSYTERKYVRKPKGSAVGMVLIDKEQTILVEPKDPFG